MIIFNGMDLIVMAIFLLLVVLLVILQLIQRFAKWRRGECHRHKSTGKLLDVASVGGGSKYECSKCGKQYWEYGSRQRDVNP